MNIKDQVNMVMILLISLLLIIGILAWIIF